MDAMAVISYLRHRRRLYRKASRMRCWPKNWKQGWRNQAAVLEWEIKQLLSMAR